MRQMGWVLLVMLLALTIASFWDSVPIISEMVHAVLDPTLGALLAFNVYAGMIVVALVINLIIILLQKYTIDRETMKAIKDEQKALREESKKHKDNPDKMLEISKQQLELVMKSWPLLMRPVMFTAVPFVLLFRWFHDLFGVEGIYHGTVFLWFMNWFWFYLVLTVIFSQLFRKWFDVI